ncbi:unnamed protein product [Nyctereutes procyonoides]|uniref:(raccoon dog) hypothetical protein n=1 Tax=Nyctereutes procyonoides TaxID=34880 RepID=A0A811YTI3_NYCPR|nr:unnamed protein product [Nyctereutes procyonoides]
MTIFYLIFAFKKPSCGLLGPVSPMLCIPSSAYCHPAFCERPSYDRGASHSTSRYN